MMLAGMSSVRKTGRVNLSFASRYKVDVGDSGFWCRLNHVKESRHNAFEDDHVRSINDVKYDCVAGSGPNFR